MGVSRPPVASLCGILGAASGHLPIRVGVVACLPSALGPLGACAGPRVMGETRAPPISSRPPWRLRRAQGCGWCLRATRAPRPSSRPPWRLHRAEGCGWRLRATRAPPISSRPPWRLRRAEGCGWCPPSLPSTPHTTSAPSPRRWLSPTRYTWAWCHHSSPSRPSTRAEPAAFGRRPPLPPRRRRRRRRRRRGSPTLPHHRRPNTRRRWLPPPRRPPTIRLANPPAAGGGRRGAGVRRGGGRAAGLATGGAHGPARACPPSPVPVACGAGNDTRWWGRGWAGSHPRPCSSRRRRQPGPRRLRRSGLLGWRSAAGCMYSRCARPDRPRRRPRAGRPGCSNGGGRSRFLGRFRRRSGARMPAPTPAGRHHAPAGGCRRPLSVSLGRRQGRQRRPCLYRGPRHCRHVEDGRRRPADAPGCAGGCDGGRSGGGGGGGGDGGRGSRVVSNCLVRCSCAGQGRRRAPVCKGGDSAGCVG